jgi:hypothetical protein
MDILVVAKTFTGKPGRIVDNEITFKDIAASVADAKLLPSTWGEAAMSIFSPFAVPTVNISKAIYESVSKSGLAIVDADIQGNVINKKTLLSAKVDYDNPLFQGVFSNKTQYSTLVKNLPSDDSDIIICDPPLAQAIYAATVSQPGVYLAEKNNVIAASKFSEGRLERLRVAILQAFSSLGASRIYVKDMTDITFNAESELPEELVKNAANLKISFSKKLDFDFSVEYNKDNLDIRPENAKEALLFLRCAPELAQTVEHLIANPKAINKIRKTVSLDISFGMKAEVISIFQGAFAGGYNRKFAVEVDF